MALSGHTFGPECLLHTTSNTFTRRASEASVDPPKISAQFFYCSALPIDDPLSPVPPPSPATKSSRVPPRPFSVHDNIALETAWLKLQNPVHSTDKGDFPKHLAKIMKDAHNEKYAEEAKSSKQKPVQQGKSPKTSAEVGKSPKQRQVERGNSLKGSAEEGNATVEAQSVGPESHVEETCDLDLTLSDDPRHIPFDTNLPITPPEDGGEVSVAPKRRSRSPFRRKEKSERPKDQNIISPRSLRKLSQAGQEPNEQAMSSSPLGRDTTGTPFLRAPPRKGRRSRSRSARCTSTRVWAAENVG